MNIDTLKATRTPIRRAVSNLIKTLESELEKNQNEISLDTIEETLAKLTDKENTLNKLDENILDLTKTENIEKEIEEREKYREQIITWKVRINKFLNKTRITIPVLTTKNDLDIKTSHCALKLPSLEIGKFDGNILNFNEFWEQFRTAVHENESIDKIQKFTYLKSYLIGEAAIAIKGLNLTSENYDIAVDIIQERFGRNELIIDAHINKLLNLVPVKKSHDINSLRKLYSECEINIRGLKNLGVEIKSYSCLLYPILIKLIPKDFVLEFTKQTYTKKENTVLELLEFLKKEIECRERNEYLFKEINNTNDSSIKKTDAYSQEKINYKTTNYGKNFPLKPKLATTSAFTTSVTKNKCIFCDSFHNSSFCNTLNIEQKREILRKQARCFLCLGLKHRISDCKLTKLNCRICKGKHNENICFKYNSTRPERNNDKNESNLDKNKVEETVTAVSHAENTRRILLQTACATVKNKRNEHLIRLLFDTGSMRTFIRENIANKLKLRTIRQEKLSVFTFGSKTPIQKSYDVVSVTLQNRHNSNSKIQIEALVTPEITGSNIPPPDIKLIKNKDFKNLILADCTDSKDPISLLIGADYYYNIITGKIKHLSRSLVAVESIFGWCLQSRKGKNDILLTLSVTVEDNLISDCIKKFYDLEASGLIDEKKELDPTENEILKEFERNIKHKNQRYEVNLPWKFEARQLNDNKKNAENRFSRLRKRFLKNPNLFFEYQDILQNYLKENIIEPVLNPDTDTNNIIFYLPHREVIRKDRPTSQLRIVFDGSAHEENSPSLNSCLHIGPNLYPDIFDILLRFRFDAVAFTADMKQAFLQIMLNENDRDVTRFLFTENPSDESQPLSVYRFTRVLFGISSSPFLLCATIKYHLKKYSKIYTDTVDFLNENIYVDDIIGSRPSVDQALNVSLETTKIFEDASISLHKWKTNSRALYNAWQDNGIISDKSPNPESFVGEKLPYKVLGIAWDNDQDLLYFDTKGLLEFVTKRLDTKRFILQVLGRIFDPIGFLGPFTLRIKILMQQVWSSGIDWDENLPEEMGSLWSKWCDEITELNHFQIPRYYFPEISASNLKKIELHVFSDASIKAYGTVAYLRLVTYDEKVLTTFISSKNRIAPLKTLTLPKLELMSAVLSARLSYNILKALKLDITCHYWTDSKITFFWIKGLPEKFKPFVKNRVAEIQKLTSSSNWHHCPGADNPADIVSRGSTVSKLINNRLWLHGPDWLSLPSEFWPKPDDKQKLDVESLEYRKKIEETILFNCMTEQLENLIDVRKYSSLEKLIRVTAWVKRFIKKIRKIPEANNTLTSEELIEAEKYLISNEQKMYFKNEFHSLINEETIDKNSPLNNLTPYLDDEKIMRLGGRLEFSDLRLEEKHPILLPKQSWLTTLIIRNEHERIMHGGVSGTLSKIRSKYWIPRGRQLVKSVLNKCIICKKYHSKPADQITAPLPRDRITDSPPFSICGVDFAGPLYIKNGKEVEKSYIVLFTCAVTRALHLELAHDMSTDSFLLAFRRFLARRGNCKVIYSDNAKTFKRSKQEIENLYKILSDDLLLKFFANERIIWKNIIERAPWWGGFYERLVKSVKDCLRKIIGKALLNYDEMSTLLVEIETVLNLRPLTYVYSEYGEPNPLTPMHFLNFGKEITYPVNFADIVEGASSKTSALRRKRYQSLLLKQLWNRWKSQYLLDLKTAHVLKNPTAQPELKIGDVVLIGDDSKNKLLWKLGIIQKTIIGRDQNIRSYEVKTANGILKRTVQHLYPLELS